MRYITGKLTDDGNSTVLRWSLIDNRTGAFLGMWVHEGRAMNLADTLIAKGYCTTHDLTMCSDYVTEEYCRKERGGMTKQTREKLKRILK